MQALTSGFRNPSLIESGLSRGGYNRVGLRKVPAVFVVFRACREITSRLKAGAAVGLACACQYLAATRFHGRHARVEATAVVEADLEEHAKGAANLFSLSWAIGLNAEPAR